LDREKLRRASASATPARVVNTYSMLAIGIRMRNWEIYLNYRFHLFFTDRRKICVRAAKGKCGLLAIERFEIARLPA
jgi:hypothetical protein